MVYNTILNIPYLTHIGTLRVAFCLARPHYQNVRIDPGTIAVVFVTICKSMASHKSNRVFLCISLLFVFSLCFEELTLIIFHTSPCPKAMPPPERPPGRPPRNLAGQGRPEHRGPPPLLWGLGTSEGLEGHGTGIGEYMIYRLLFNLTVVLLHDYQPILHNNTEYVVNNQRML